MGSTRTSLWCHNIRQVFLVQLLIFNIVAFFFISNYHLLFLFPFTPPHYAFRLHQYPPPNTRIQACRIHNKRLFEKKNCQKLETDYSKWLAITWTLSTYSFWIRKGGSWSADKSPQLLALCTGRSAARNYGRCEQASHCKLVVSLVHQYHHAMTFFMVEPQNRWHSRWF